MKSRNSQPTSKPVEKAPPVAAPRNMWTMRVLKPGRLAKCPLKRSSRNRSGHRCLRSGRPSTSTNTLAGEPAAKANQKR